mmetsp:Transcript_52330/g.121680  ORF Transcript_52330/g.121680 Transcript_52330/m.121680 type:complete len:349 (+) Transcript_52330:179-1225(+)
MTSALLLALVTKRRYVIDHAGFFDAFDDPSTGAGTLNYRNVARELRPLSTRSLALVAPAFAKPTALRQELNGSQQLMPSEAQGAGCGGLLREALFSREDVLVYQCGCSFELDLLNSQDTQIRHAIQSIFGSFREDVLVEVMVRYLTLRPVKSLVDNAHEVMASWHHEGYDGFAMVQDRKWTDVKGRDRGDKERNTDRPHLNCTYKHLQAYKAMLPGKQRLLIGVTSDSRGYAKVLVRAFSELGDVRRNTLFTDNAISYAQSSTPLPARQFMVDWYILAEAPFVVCSGSTYCISARASKGFGNDGTFPFISDRRTYRQGGSFCYGQPVDNNDRFTIDTLSEPVAGRVFW